MNRLYTDYCIGKMNMVVYRSTMFVRKKRSSVSYAVYAIEYNGTIVKGYWKYISSLISLSGEVTLCIDEVAMNMKYS